MKHPQTLAKELGHTKNLSNIGDNACCAFVFLWCLGIEPTDVEAIKIVDDALKDNVIDSDCTVRWYDFGNWLTGRAIDIEKIKINSIKNIKVRTPVLFSINGKDGHWVGVENGKIGFNPLEYSKNVEEGKPIEARKIIIKGLAK